MTLRELIARLRLRLLPAGTVDYINRPDALPPPLTREEESLTAAKLKGGSDVRKSACEKLIVHNLRLVVYIAKKFDPAGCSQEDLVSIGTIGLIKAVRSFDPDKNIRLATYASRCIENEILMYLRKMSGRPAEVSIDEPLSADRDGNELLLSDVISSGEEPIGEKLARESERARLMAEIEKLSPREREIMELRFGLRGGRCLTQKQAAERIGISQSYISRLEKKIIKGIRERLEVG